MERKLACCFLAFFLLALAVLCQSRPITGVSAADYVSDGIHSLRQPKLLSLNRFFSSDDCTETYGFLPCTTTTLGNVFLILVYGFLMFVGAKKLSDGSEILLGILGPGIIGGLFLPILCTLPDAAIILASGLSGTTEEAQSQVSVGMGLLAGSTVMLLTLLWGTCLIVGKCDLENSVPVDQKDTKFFSLTGSGVGTDIGTEYDARIMTLSVIPFIIVQLPYIFQVTSLSRTAVLISFIFSTSLLLAYCIYQIIQPWIQKRRVAFAKRRHLMSGILRNIKLRVLGRLVNDDGEPNIDVIERLFKTVDLNSDGILSEGELRALVIGIKFEELNTNVDEAVAELLKEFDAAGNGHVDLKEFIDGISKWLSQVRHSARHGDSENGPSIKSLNEFDQNIKKETDPLLGEQDDELTEKVENAKWNAAKAVLMLLLGTIIAAVTADPLVDAVDNFSTATGISSLLVSFVILPFVSSSEVVSTLIFASKKKKRMASLMYSEIYGSVTVSNLLSLAVLLGLVYFRQLTWDFSSEVLVVVVVCILIGLIASFRIVYPLWIALVAYALYPLSLSLVYILNYVLGWS